jgi:hypothetical protein
MQGMKIVNVRRKHSGQAMTGSGSGSGKGRRVRVRVQDIQGKLGRAGWDMQDRLGQAGAGWGRLGQAGAGWGRDGSKYLRGPVRAWQAARQSRQGLG